MESRPAATRNFSAFMCVALPTPAELRLLKRPLLLVAGANDEYCPADELRAYGDSAAEVVILDGTDHYLWRREREAAAIVGDFADRTIASIL